ncbi:MAG: MATE family efflux transporter [Ruminococcaceae bacterium]|nr:MATE family efflux transporter [Oscillospiraceae bacterium]
MKKSATKHTLAVIFALAWPTMLEQLMQTAVQYIDVAMVGSLGTAATAAVGATTTVNWLVGSTVSALGVGFLSFIAKACGAGDREKAARATAQAVLVTLVCGVLFTVLTLGCSRWVPVWMQVDEHIQLLAGQYFFILYTPMLFRAATAIFGTALRAAGDTQTPMRVGILVNLTNVVLNFLFIFPTRTVPLLGGTLTLYGAGMGVLGAALASALAFTVGGICITVALWRHPLISPRGHSLCPDKTVLLPCLKVALPNMLQRFGTSLGYVAFASMINALGEVATATHTVANTVESAFYIPGYGMQTAAATLAGNALGAGDRRRMREMTRTTLAIETVLMGISGALLFLLAPTMLHLFSDNPAVIALGTRVLRMVALSEPIFGIAIILEGVMLGVGRTMAPFVFNLTGMWGVRIVGTFLCTRFFGGGLVAAWGCMIAHNVLLFLLFLVYYFRGKWNPLETKKEKIG